jgi:hypothetical protein
LKKKSRARTREQPGYIGVGKKCKKSCAIACTFPKECVHLHCFHEGIKQGLRQTFALPLGKQKITSPFIKFLKKKFNETPEHTASPEVTINEP